MKLFTIAILIASEDEKEALAFVAKTKKEAENIAESARKDFKYQYFNGAYEVDYEESENGKRTFFSAWSNVDYIEFNATIEEVEI